jgi:hypothetical protein
MINPPLSSPTSIQPGFAQTPDISIQYRLILERKCPGIGPQGEPGLDAGLFTHNKKSPVYGFKTGL